MRIYWVLLLAGCRRQAAYRLALVSGLLTNGFFGIVRTAVFLALYHDRGLVAGLGFSDALTYTWLLEALFPVVWATWRRSLCLAAPVRRAWRRACCG